jgi:hypothetical protein
MNFRITNLIAIMIFPALALAANNTIIVIPDKPNSYLRSSENSHAGYSGTSRDSGVVAEDENAKAQILAEYFQKAMGFTPAIVMESKMPVGNLRKIYIGMTGFTKKNIDGITDLLDDGFVIDTTDPANIIIAGPTSWGTEFGVYEFLERYLGVRWLLPGPYGEDVVHIQKLNIKKQERIIQNPTFFSRLYSGLKTDEIKLWARRNRMHGHIDFHHNLDKLLAVSKYAKTNPEFYPLIDGKRVIPLPDKYKQFGLEHPWDWNPCFSSQSSIDEAIKVICVYFKKHPNRKSYSLGMNDSKIQCHCADCLAADSNSTNFLGKKNLSDRFFTWANAVAEGVLKEHPDKYFGMLAYHQLIEPPVKTKIHDRIIPYFCYDRYRWVKDSAARQNDIGVTAEWAKVAANVGWYDYFYGSPYAAPRVHFHKMVESLRFARDNNVTVLYGEAYPNFGEGPKLYLALKMLWNVDADPDQLLNDWYVRCVGYKSATYLKQYFESWENIWATKIPNSPWWRDTQHYLQFNVPTYLGAITSQDIAKVDDLMQKTVAYAQTASQKKRAEALAKTFQYYKLTWYLFHENKLASSTPNAKTSQQAIEFIERGIDALTKAQQRRKIALEEFPNDPILLQPVSIDRHGLLKGEDWGEKWFYKAGNLAAEGDLAVLKKLNSLTDYHVKSIRQAAQNILKKVSK